MLKRRIRWFERVSISGIFFLQIHRCDRVRLLQTETMQEKKKNKRRKKNIWDDRVFDFIRVVVEGKNFFAVFSLLLVSSVVTDPIHLTHTYKLYFRTGPWSHRPHVAIHMQTTETSMTRAHKWRMRKEKKSKNNSKMWSRLKSGNYRFVWFGQLNNLLRSFSSYLDDYYYLCRLLLYFLFVLFEW